MRYWLGVTDNEWFEFLSRSGAEEVNFWQPNGRAPFVGLEPGAPFLFKLKRPFNHVAGGGTFVRFTTLPLSLNERTRDRLEKGVRDVTIEDPWTISETAYPAAGTTEEQLRFMLNYAVLAPSGHNTQPWLFRVEDDAVELRADRTRGLPVVDPEDRALVISCGAALFHLRIALRHFGYEDELETLPDPDDPDLLARVRTGASHEGTGEEHSLFEAIPKRRSNRGLYEDRPVPGRLLSALQAAAWEEGAWLHLVEDETPRHAIAELIAEGDRIQLSDRRFRRELASWVHPNRTRSRDGVPGYAFGFGDVMSLAGPFVMRTFDTGKGQAAKDRQLAEGSPVLAVLGTEGDTVSEWLAAGQALARVLLRARAEGVWASFLNQPIEVPELRPRLAMVIAQEGYPQVLFRMGYGQDVRPTPRRPATETTAP